MRGTWIGLLVVAMVFAPAMARAAGNDASTPAQALETVLALQVDGELDIDATGAVAAHRIHTSLPDPVRASLDRRIPAWRFESRFPGEAIAPVTVKMQVALRAEKTEAAYRVSVDGVRLWVDDAARGGRHEDEVVTIGFGKLKPPSYPLALLDAGVQGKVLVGLLLAADGSVARAVVVQSQLYDATGQPAQLRKALEQFERATLDGARRWKFSVESHGGVPTPADLTVMVPVNYVFDMRQPTEARWRTVVRTAKQPPEWLPAVDDRARLGVSDVGNGGPVPAAPRIRLADDPAGSAL